MKNNLLSGSFMERPVSLSALRLDTHDELIKRTRELNDLIIQHNERTCKLLDEIEVSIEICGLERHASPVATYELPQGSPDGMPLDEIVCAMGIDCLAMCAATTEACPNRQTCEVGAESVQLASLLDGGSSYRVREPSLGWREYISIGNHFHQFVALLLMGFWGGMMLGYVTFMAITTPALSTTDFEVLSDIEELDLNSL